MASHRKKAGAGDGDRHAPHTFAEIVEIISIEIIIGNTGHERAGIALRRKILRDQLRADLVAADGVLAVDDANPGFAVGRAVNIQAVTRRILHPANGIGSGAVGDSPVHLKTGVALPDRLAVGINVFSNCGPLIVLSRRAAANSAEVAPNVLLASHGQHVLAVQPRRSQQLSVHGKRRRGCQSAELRHHQIEIDKKEFVGVLHLQIVRLPEALAFCRWIRSGPVDVFQIELLFVGGIADGIKSRTGRRLAKRPWLILQVPDFRRCRRRRGRGNRTGARSRKD